MATEFDAALYRQLYPDVVAAGVDPLAHYLGTGWREGRQPAAWFDTVFYLDANPDVAAAGIDPFWHFLAAGRREGRAPGGRADARAEQLARALRQPIAPDDADGRDAGHEGQGVPPEELRARLDTACLGRKGIVLSIGHDDYAVCVGGTQIITALEQQAFARAGYGYLHAAPVRPSLGLAAPGPLPVAVALRLDGAPAGRTTWGGLRLALDGLAPRGARWLVIHSLLGHRPEDVARLREGFAPERSVFWVHDYASICGGVQLLRNDTFACGAPPRDSVACRVCRHGPGRPLLQARLRPLFEALGCEILAPSSTALAQWVSAADLPWRAARVHPHATLELAAGTARPRLPGKPRLAFVGHPMFHKGWAFFAAFAAAARRGGDVALFHLAAGHPSAAPDGSAHDGVTRVACAVTPDDPDATIRALARHAIDAVLVLSPWPETFCLVAHEALAAGAGIICLAGSGHVAELVRRTGRGIILPDERALPSLLRSPQARAWLLDGCCRAAGLRMRRSGGAADLLLAGPGLAGAQAS